MDIIFDRDGVINHEKKEDYIFNWRNLNFMRSPEAIKLFNEKFGHIIIVTNQRGVGKI